MFFARLVFVVALSIPLFASAAELRGVVEDTDGLPVPNAIVVDAAGHSVHTDDSGHFAIIGVKENDVVLQVHADGFKDKKLEVKADSLHAPVHIALSVAPVTEELTVRATAADPVASDANLSGFQIESDLLKSVPTQESNPLAAASLFVDPAANGSEGTRVVVDGVEGGDLDVPASSVKRVSVNKNPYSAEFSRPGRGRIEVQTRPGSLKRMHKRFTLTARDATFDARNAFATQQPDMRRILSEFEVDGPLRKFGSFYVGGDYLFDNEQSIVRAITPSGSLGQDVQSPERRGHLMGRTDLRLSSMNTLSVRYAFTRDSLRNQGVGGFDLAERAFNASKVRHEFRVGDTHAFNSGVLNELRFTFKDKIDEDSSVNSAAASIVKGAFHAGGAQIDDNANEKSYQIEDLVGISRGKHTLRFGGSLKHRNIDLIDRSNAGGTFTFASIESFLAGQPTLFTQTLGNPAVSFGYDELSWFAQDEIKLRPNLGLMVGVRHEYQTLLSDANNFAPRFALSYAPGDAKTVLRFGGGIFYEHESEEMEQQQQLFDGTHLKRIVLSDPGSLTPNASTALGTITRAASGLRAPYLAQASFAVEHQISAKTSLSVEYTATRGLHRFRSRDVTPLGSAAQQIYEIESTGSSRANSLNTTLRTSFSRFEVMAQYTFSKSMDDTAGALAFPASSFDLRSEWARSDFDRRHRFNLAGIARLPYDLKLGTILQASSGIPLNVVTGADVNGDGILTDRPFGIARNSAQGPGLLRMDLRLSRRFLLVSGESKKKAPYAEFRFDAFNVLNTVNAPSYVGVITSPLFGRANTALAARQMQVSLRIGF